MQEKILPHNIDAEKSVLGSMFLSKYALQKSVENLSSDLFYLDAHGKIFMVISELAEKGTPIDITTVTAALDEKNYLHQLVEWNI